MADTQQPLPKRQKLHESSSMPTVVSNHATSQQGEQEQLGLKSLVMNNQWEEAEARVRLFPAEAASTIDPTPLALACRNGAPASCVKAILEACPTQVRHVLDSRGTPLHEAIVCEHVGVDVIEALLSADESLGNSSTRATLLQDVDGFTPLHMLIRRRFQWHILQDDGLMQILQMLVKSCPEAVVVPDRGEYEEPPIVYALKANLFMMAGHEDATTTLVERRIYEMVACMIEHYPQAASRVFARAGYRGQYTAVHSAVFHGRSPKTLEILLEAAARFPGSTKACLLGNTQGEMPLHFCTMRGEPPRSVALLAKAAPEAILTRDASGLMPMHWLWVRFVSTLVSLEDGGPGSDETITLNIPTGPPADASPYSAFASLEQDDFDNDLLLIRRLDPSVDFLRMRHIPLDVLGEEDSMRWALRTAEILAHVRSRYERNMAAAREGNVENQEVVWTRLEVVACLFWTKLVSLLEAWKTIGGYEHRRGHSLVHAAFANPCCLPAVVRIVVSLFPEEIDVPDEHGRFPLHYACMRDWHSLDWPLEAPADDESKRPARLFQLESNSIVKMATQLALESSERSARMVDIDHRLPLHYLVDSFIQASVKRAWSTTDRPIRLWLDVMRNMVRLYPDSLQIVDGRSHLYPFLQATAEATTCNESSSIYSTELQVSITYLLLRENPTLLQNFRT